MLSVPLFGVSIIGVACGGSYSQINPGTNLTFYFVETYSNAYFGRTRRGYQMLLHEDFGYVREKQKQNTTNWKCSLHAKFRCKARAVTKELDGQHFVRITCGTHTHAPHAGPDRAKDYAAGEIKDEDNGSTPL